MRSLFPIMRDVIKNTLNKKSQQYIFLEKIIPRYDKTINITFNFHFKLLPKIIPSSFIFTGCSHHNQPFMLFFFFFPFQLIIK